MLGYLQNLFQALDVDSMLGALLRVLAVLLCLTVHETCHGFAAYVLGDPTAKSQRRLSLNPLRHIDWLGLAMMFFVGFGWAKAVPVDPRHFKKPKQGMAVTALAGPVSNFLLAVLALGICKVIYLYAPYSTVLELIFNFLPIPPLDGSKVLGALLPDETYFRLMRYERYGMLLLLALSYFGITSRLISGAIQGVYLGLVKLFFY